MSKKNSKKTKKNSKTSIFTRFTKNKKLTSLVLTISILVIIIGVGIYSNLQKDSSPSQSTPKIITSGNLNHQIAKDIVSGDQNAPVTIIEYASLSCPHCANFYNKIYSKIEEKYVKTGKVKFIYRDFPLNQSAMMASVISLCHARNNDSNPDKYYKFIKVLFKTQDSWAFTGEFFEKLRSIAKLDGMTTKQFDDCVNNKALIDEILQDRLLAAKELNIHSTPSFVINGKAIGGYKDYKQFKKLIDNEL